jgi:hypothetical protein
MEGPNFVYGRLLRRCYSGLAVRIVVWSEGYQTFCEVCYHFIYFTVTRSTRMSGIVSGSELALSSSLRLLRH